jgi:hypothetical protein
MPASPEMGALARQRYAEKVAISPILAETGMSLGHLYWWLDGCPTKGEPLLPKLPRRRDVKGKRRRTLQGNRVSLVTRLWRTAERQVRDVEERLKRAGLDAGERERDARLMAVLVKTVRELTAIDEKNPELAPENDERDLDEFRRDLTRKVEAIIAARGTASAAHDDGR